MPLGLHRLVDRLARPLPSQLAGRSAAEQVAARKQAELVVRERATREAAAFQEALAACVIDRLGIASALTADDVHVHLARILAGSAALTFLDGIAGELRRKRVVLAGRLPDHDHLAACLCSPMMSRLVRRRLDRSRPVADDADEPD